MGAETEAVSVMEVKYLGASKPSCDLLRPPDLVSIDLNPSQLVRIRLRVYEFKHR